MRGAHLLAAAALVLAGCAGTPAEKGPAAAQPPARAGRGQLERAQAALQIGAPQDLIRAAQLASGLPEPEASETASLAAALFHLLYPALPAEELASLPPYQGRYRSLLDAAARGAPPAGAPGSSFLELTLAGLYLATIPAGGGPGTLAPARAALQRAAEMNPRSVLPPYLLGRAAEAAGDLSTARDLYRGCLSIDKSVYPARLRLGVVETRLGEAEKAISTLESLAEEPAFGSEARVALAEAYLAEKRFQEAGEQAARALIASPDSAEALLLRARSLIEQGNWAQARRPLDLLLQQHPERPEGYLWKARLLHDRMRDTEGALELLRRAAARFPDSAEVQELTGRVLLDDGREQEGVARLERALQLQPGRAATLRLLLRHAAESGRWKEAASYLEAIPEGEATQEDLRMGYRVSTSLGDEAGALRYAGLLYEKESGAQAAADYAGALLGAGRTGEARRVIEEALGGKAEGGARGRLLYLRSRTQQDAEQAERDLRSALVADPNNPEALSALAQRYVSEKRYREARIYLRRAVELSPKDEGLRIRLQEVEAALNAAGGSAGRQEREGENASAPQRLNY